MVFQNKIILNHETPDREVWEGGGYYTVDFDIIIFYQFPRRGKIPKNSITANYDCISHKKPKNNI